MTCRLESLEKVGSDRFLCVPRHGDANCLHTILQVGCEGSDVLPVCYEGLPEFLKKFTGCQNRESDIVPDLFLLKVPGIPGDEILYVCRDRSREDRRIVVMDDVTGRFDSLGGRIINDQRGEMYHEGMIVGEEGGQLFGKISVGLNEHLSGHHRMDDPCFAETNDFVGSTGRRENAGKQGAGVDEDNQPLRVIACFVVTSSLPIQIR